MSLTNTRAPLKIVHIITGLNVGGAETMLLKLLRAGDRHQLEPTVISLLDKGQIGPEIEKLGIPVLALNMRSANPQIILKLRKLLKILQPQVVQTWMYHADLIGGLAARSAGIQAIAWNIRQSVLERRSLKRSTYLIARACALLSRWVPKAIVSCSVQAARVHQAFGYSKQRMRVIPNGFELDRFRPNQQARAAVRDELGIGQTAPLVGLIARFDAQKDHRSFILAARLVRQRHPNCRFLLCGADISPKNPALAAWLEEAGLTECCHLLGQRSDTPALNAALDMAVSASSYGEGFPNVLGEAMACGAPCVTTDVGDSALVVGDAGRVVKPNDPEALADAINDLLSLPASARQQLGAAARARIEAHFSLASVARQYAELYASLAKA